MRCQYFLAVMAAASFGCVKPNTNMSMWTHFDRTRDAHEAILRGQLFEAQRAGQWLADHPETNLPRGAERFGNEIAQNARDLADARNLTEAALRTARIAETCGECHSTFGPGPSFSGEGLPETATGDVATEMRRHSWAVGRMWEGLIGPSDAAWMVGANVLKDAPLLPSEMGNPADIDDDIQSLERRVHELGQLSVAATESERVVIYSNVMTTCASCHTLIRGN